MQLRRAPERRWKTMRMHGATQEPLWPIRAAFPPRSHPPALPSSPAATLAMLEGVADQLRRNLAALHTNLQRSVQDVAAQAAALCQGAHMRQQPSGLPPLFAVSPRRCHQRACGVSKLADDEPQRPPRPLAQPCRRSPPPPPLPARSRSARTWAGPQRPCAAVPSPCWSWPSTLRRSRRGWTRCPSGWWSTTRTSLCWWRARCDEATA